MEYGAIDLHRKKNQVRIISESGELIDHRIATTRQQLTGVFSGRPRMQFWSKPRPIANGWHNIWKHSGTT
jgi:hypothetical protein